LDEGLDTGPVYRREDTTIGPDETVSELYDRLAVLGAPLMLGTIEGIINGTLKPAPQDHCQATLAPILKKEDGFLDWNRAATEIHNRVRAFNPWPGTIARFRGAVCKILKTRLPTVSAVGESGSTMSGSIQVSKGSLRVVCGGGTLLEVLSIQPENRKTVSGTD